MEAAVRPKRRIVFISPGFPGDAVNTHCIPPLQAYARALGRQRDVELTVISLHRPAPADKYLWHGIQVIALGGNNITYPFRLGIWRKALRTLKDLHREAPIDLIHSFWLHECAMIGSRFAKRHEIAHVATAMGQDVKRNNRFLRWISKDTPIVCLSSFQEKYLRTYYKRRAAAIIPWGIPGRDMQWVRPEEDKEWDVVTVGSLIPLKQQFEWLAVVRDLKYDFPHIRTAIVGEGPMRKAIERRISEWGLEENVKLLGLLERPEVFRVMCRSSVFVHPSRFESQGYVIFEALLCGLPVVSFAVGIAPEIIGIDLCNNFRDMEHAVARLLRRKKTPVNSGNMHVADMRQTLWNYLQLYGDLIVPARPSENQNREVVNREPA